MSQVSFSNTALELSPANMARLVNILIPPSPDILAEYSCPLIGHQSNPLIGQVLQTGL